MRPIAHLEDDSKTSMFEELKFEETRGMTTKNDLESDADMACTPWDKGMIVAEDCSIYAQHPSIFSYCEGKQKDMERDVRG